MRPYGSKPGDYFDHGEKESNASKRRERHSARLLISEILEDETGTQDETRPFHPLTNEA